MSSNFHRGPDTSVGRSNEVSWTRAPSRATSWTMKSAYRCLRTPRNPGREEAKQEMPASASESEVERAMGAGGWWKER